MKKLVIAAVAMMTAVCVKAAAVDWSVGDVQDSPKATAAEGWVAYLVAGENYDTFAALDNSAKAAWVSANNLQSTTTYEGRNGMEIFGEAAGSWSAGATATAFAVLFDNASAAGADYIAWSDIGSASISALGENGSIDFGDFAEMGGSNGWVATAIPEPTSGLLLLIGMAGLALRRRRA